MNPRVIDYPFDGLYAARHGRKYRVRYEIDEERRRVVVLHFLHRGSAYRT